MLGPSGDSLTPLWSQRVTAGEYLCTSKNGFVVHYVVFDQIFKVQHLRFKSFGIYFVRGKIPIYKEKNVA